MKENPIQRPAKETKNDKRSKEERINVVKAFAVLNFIFFQNEEHTVLQYRGIIIDVC
jgi:hypothetical protein